MTKSVSPDAVAEILRKLEPRDGAPLSAAERKLLHGIVSTWREMVAGLTQGTLSTGELRGRLGISRRRGTRSPADATPPPSTPDTDEAGASEHSDADLHDETAQESADKPDRTVANRDNHGRRAKDSFADAPVTHHRHSILQVGCRCPKCSAGKLYEHTPCEFTTIQGQAPLTATRHVAERLQCNSCKAVFKAPLPQVLQDDGVGGRLLYSYSAVAMVTILRCFGGFPMHRQETFQSAIGVRIPDSSIWNMIEGMADVLRPIWRHLEQVATSANLFYGDDTGVLILNERAKVKKNRKTGKLGLRTGCHTTCVIARGDDDRLIIMFRSGIHHTGEVMDALIADRDEDLPAPAFMGDALSSNDVTTGVVLYASCNAHAVRRFKELADKHPEETDFVLSRYKAIYENEAHCVNHELTGEARRAYHQAHSRPLLREMTEYGEEQFEKRTVEPNSDLGAAFEYLIKHERRLAAFTRHENTPLDNNRCERALKTVVRIRDTGLYFRNAVTATIADGILTVGATAIEAGVNPFEYFCAIQRHRDDVRENPQRWLPWAYEARARELTQELNHP